MGVRLNTRTCNGHSRRTGKPCHALAMKGKTKCYLHGGRTPRGPAHGAFKHGRYSTVLPVRLAARYEEALANPALLSLRDDVAAAESRLADLFARVDSGESGQLWQDLRTAYDAFALAQATGDLDAMTRHFATMGQRLKEGSNDYAAWEEIEKLWTRLCTLVQTETKTLLTMQQMVTVQQVATMMGAMTHAITEAVQTHADEPTGRKILGDISQEFLRLSTLEMAQA